jgi:hypothetical protein
MAHLQSIYKPTNGPRKVGHNTRIDRGSNFCTVTYHRTTVFTWNIDELGNERIVVNTGGWFTKTTAERINYALGLVVTLSLLTRDLPNVWRVTDNHGNAWSIRGRTLTLKRDVTDQTWVRV